MFEQTFVQGTGELRKPWPMAASLAGQLLAVGAILAVPLFQTARIAWTPPLALYIPAPVPPRVKIEARNNSSPAAITILRAVFRPRFTAPMRIPEKISLIGDAPPVTGMNAVDGYAGISVLGTGIGSSIAVAPPRPAEDATLPPKPKPTAIRASSGVQQAMLIHEVKPPYPPLARTARISGVVRLAAIIARDGSIQNLRLLSGPPLLVKAAMEAVQKWRYKPTLLGGEPVEVITEIDVNFTLSN